jgi:hypothetical protein
MNLHVSPRLDANVQAQPTTTNRALMKDAIPFIEVARAIVPLIVLWVHLALGWCGMHVSQCTADNSWQMPSAYISIINQLHLYDAGGHIGIVAAATLVQLVLFGPLIVAAIPSLLHGGISLGADRRGEATRAGPSGRPLGNAQ